MGKTILFSPVGITDPVSPKNFYDGSMLHICRHLKPDVVYLYLSSEMTEKEHSDHRFTRAINLLSKKINHEIKVHLIEKPDLVKAHEFDFFFEEFGQILKKLTADKAKDDTLLINISSGTPGMKSALSVMSALGEYDCQCVQIAMPERTYIQKEEKYDLDTYFGLNPDNEENVPARISKIKSPNLLYMRDKQNIIEFIKKYDYEAAYQLSEKLPLVKFEKIRPYLLFAKARYSLNIIEANTLKKSLPQDFFPVKGLNQKLFEYALACEIKRRKGELADFIRALTPMIVGLYAKIAKHHIYDLSNLYKTLKKSNSKSHVWDKKKILVLSETDETVAKIKLALSEKYEDFFSPSKLDIPNYINSDSICAIIVSPEFNLNKIASDVSLLRDNVEKTIRNNTAHQMIEVNEKKIEKLTGLNSENIMELIRRLFSYTDIVLTEDCWNSYDHMNEILIGVMQE